MKNNEKWVSEKIANPLILWSHPSDLNRRPTDYELEMLVCKRLFLLLFLLFRLPGVVPVLVADGGF